MESGNSQRASGDDARRQLQLSADVDALFEKQRDDAARRRTKRKSPLKNETRFTKERISLCIHASDKCKGGRLVQVLLSPGKLRELGWQRSMRVEPALDRDTGSIVARITDAPKGMTNTLLSSAGRGARVSKITITAWFERLVKPATPGYGTYYPEYRIANGILAIKVPREWLAETAAHKRKECHQEVVSEALDDLGAEPTIVRQSDASVGELHPLLRDADVLASISLLFEELERCGKLVR